MDNPEENNNAQARDGVKPNKATARSSRSVNYSVHDSNWLNPNQFSRDISVPSSQYINSHTTLPVDHAVGSGTTVQISKRTGGSKSKGTSFGSSSSSQQGLPGKAVVAANEELKLIENIADFLSPEEVRHLLFQGHENEHIARQFLTPDIGSTTANRGHRNEDLVHQSAPHPPQMIDVRMSCLYCHRNLLYDAAIEKRPCGHYFHLHCFHAQPPSVKDQHVLCPECYFCTLEKQ